MDQELDAAVDWWTDVLANPPGRQRAGDALIDATQTVMRRAVYTPLTEAQISAFRVALRAELVRRIGTNWYPDNPRFGGALDGRVVATDYGVDPTHNPLGVALAAAGIVNTRGFIQDERLPIKTIMWIEPGRVTVAGGYGARSGQVWPEREEAGSAGPLE